MQAYAVTWGPVSAAVFAENEANAWAKFCEAHDLARQYPKLHARKIEVTKEIDSSTAPKAVAAKK